MAYATNTFNVSYNGTTVHVDELDFRLLLLFRIPPMLFLFLYVVIFQ